MRHVTMWEAGNGEAARAVRALLLGLAIGGLPAGSHSIAQQSASFRVESAVINSGGHPEQGMVLAGATYRISLDALGDGVVAAGLGSVSWRVDGGFVSTYPPPGEVQNQRFTSASTMTWDAEKSAGEYEVYRGLVSTLPGTFGTCFQSALASPTASDSGTPSLGDAWVYFVTVRNRIGEEGTKGFQSNNSMRTNPSPCP